MKEKTNTTKKTKNDKNIKTVKQINTVKKETNPKTKQLKKEKATANKANTKKVSNKVTKNSDALKNDVKKTITKKNKITKENTKLNKNIDIKKELKTKDVIEPKVNENLTIKEETNIVKNSTVLSIILAILCIFLLFKLVDKNDTNQHKLQELCVNCFDETATYTLPDNWKIAEDGSLFLEDNNLLVIKGGLYAYEDSKENFDLMLESLKSSYDVEESTINEFKVAKVIEEYPEQKVSYYFAFKNDRSFQLVLINEEENVSNTILKSFKY